MQIRTISNYQNYNYPPNQKYYNNVIFKADIFNKKALEEVSRRLQESEARNVLLEKYTGALEELLKRISIARFSTGSDILTNIANEFRAQLTSIIPTATTVPVHEVSLEDFYQEILSKLEKPLQYDPMKPVYKKVADKSYSYQKEFSYIEQPKPTSVPEEILKTSDLIKELETKGEVTISYQKGRTKKFIKNKDAYINPFTKDLGRTLETETTARYGRRVEWTIEKIIRDLLQNFFDAQGHTLEGTIIKIVKISSGRYKIRIEGLAEYGYENIKYTGSGNKEESLYNAGGFGEGTKILSAALLASGKVSEIDFSSANWKIRYGLSDSDIEKAIITRRLDILEQPTEGNYVEFETTDKDFAHKIIQARNYFYHPENPDFKDLTYENEDWGFKILPKGENGNLYLTQRFEYEQSGSWENPLERLTLIFKRRPKESGILDKNRDRINLRKSEIRGIIKSDFIKTLSDEELMDLILKTETLWNYTKGDPCAFTVAGDLVDALLDEASLRGFKFNFGDKKFISDNGFVLQDIKDRMVGMGYEIINGKFKYLGVPTVTEIYQKTRLHVPLEPTEIEKKKLILLEEAVAILAESPKMQGRITAEDARKPRFIFDSKEAGEELVLAEAVVDEKQYLGHWVDRKYLSEAPFYKILGTWLHEITHKYAGDGTMDFGYKLTDVMGLELESLMGDSDRLKKLQFLKSEYEKLM